MMLAIGLQPQTHIYTMNKHKKPRMKMQKIISKHKTNPHISHYIDQQIQVFQEYGT